jgi:predicted dehydrogenase
MQPTRRQFLTTASLAAAGYWIGGCATSPRVSPRRVAANSKLHIGCIGIGGQGGGVTSELVTFPNVHIAALCDVDEKHAAGARTKYPGRPFYRDFREMLAKETQLDAVMIGTPDHWHAPIALAAMLQGKHVYCEKPLSHTIEEARLMEKAAKLTGVVTQMGNNGHAGEGLRRTKEWIDAGVIGAVKEVHVWSDRPGKFWKSQGQRRPSDTQPVPPSLDWNLWLGPAADRPYHPAYVPREWRGWIDFGCGALGDMAVHNADPAYYALDLGAPDWVEATSSETNTDSFPTWSITTYHFPAKSRRGDITMKWYDGGKMPPRPANMDPDRPLPDNGIYFVGEGGAILCGGWSGTPSLVPARKDFQPPSPTIPRSVGHRREWVDACFAGKPENAQAGFWYSAPFTESLLVGLLPVLAGKQRIEWNAGEMKAVNTPEADRFIRKAYRDGFGLPITQADRRRWTRI